MHLRPNKLSLLLTLRSVFTIVLISFLTISGCNDNNSSNNDGLGATETSCSTLSSPCNTISQNEDSTKFVCSTLSSEACAVDLEDVVSQVDPDGTSVDNKTTMWIEAWGGHGGSSDKGADGGAAGYALTTTTIQDIKSINSGSSTIYYFLGTPGLDSPERCGGGGGGVSTIVTTEDLVLNPNSDPTQSAPPILLVAGGGGGGAAANKVGLYLTGTTFNGGQGGTAIASLEGDGQGAGEASTGAGGSFGGGGNENGMGKGGSCNCKGPDSDKNPTNGTDGFGGHGGVGGSGPDCGGRGADNFSNTPVKLSFSSGQGGKGGSASGSCAAGGGAGGGGYGAGGGGSHGNESEEVIGGGGGGSFAIQSSQFSSKTPTDRQSNPCDPTTGCVRITFTLD